MSMTAATTARRRCCARRAPNIPPCASCATATAAARAPVIATLDGDGQNDPADIPALVRRLLDEPPEARSFLLVAGFRHKRRDDGIRKLSSRIANRVRAAMLKDDTPDTGCGLKVFTREAFLDMPRFDHMHRFLPALMIRRGGRVVSVPVNHRPRQRGVSKYGVWNRLWVGIVDLFGVMWLQHRANLPQIETRE
jgi:dolichol-phosphate mannosyltransferase